MQLTALQCRNAKPKPKRYKLTDGMGLYLEVAPSGAKNWYLQYSYHGKRPRIGLGPYPSIALSDAREERDVYKKLLRQGLDPVQVRRQSKRQRAQECANTFEAIALEWHASQQPAWSQHYAADLLARLKRDVFPEIGSAPITDLKTPDILAIVRRCEARRSFDIAKRNLQCVGRVFRFAIATGRCEHDPTYRLWEALAPSQKSHFPAISARELPEFLCTLKSNSARLFPQTLIATELLMLTFVRTSELIKATWDEFDLEQSEWSIPAARMKMRRPHRVPLSTQVCALVRQAKLLAGDSAYVFPHANLPNRHMSNCTILRALERMGYRGRMTGHGFRALAMSTIKEKLGYRHEVIDRQLAHQPRNKVDRAYDRAEFLDERRAMMQAWADYLEQTYRQAVRDER